LALIDVPGGQNRIEMRVVNQGLLKDQVLPSSRRAALNGIDAFSSHSTKESYSKEYLRL
jgi:hypothetical protein